MGRRADRLFVDARVSVTPGEQVFGWVAVKDGRVMAAGETSPPQAEVVHDCGGALVLPGLVDMHVHFRDPDATTKEDFGTGSMAAAFGGVTCVVDMPAEHPPTLAPEDVVAKASQLAGRSFVDFGLYAQLGDSAGYMRELRDLGVVGLKWFMGYEANEGAGHLRKDAILDAMRAAADCRILIGVHAESFPWIVDLSESVSSSGRHDVHAHTASRPDFVEALGVAEACILAGESGAAVHIHHLSSGLGLRTATLLRGSIRSRVSIETCPHYLLLDEADVSRLGSAARVNPPIKSAADRQALWGGVLDGTVDCVATDHAPHLESQKLVDNIWKASSGLVGVETSFPLLFNEVVHDRLPLSRFIELTSEMPARISGFSSKGSLSPGNDADLIVVDPDARTVIKQDQLHSKVKLSVYDGWECGGRIRQVYLRGALLIDEGRVVDGPRGRFVPAARGD